MRPSIAFISLLFLINCAEEENVLTSREYSRVRTMKVTNISSEGAVANGEVIFESTEILDHGFIWSRAPKPALGESEKISLGPLTGAKQFSAIIERSLAEGQKYYIAAYVVNKGYTVYGDVVSFVSLGSMAPVLSKITPTIGTWGDTITLVGKNFNAISSTNEVRVANKLATVIKAVPDTLLVSIPITLVTDKADVSVSFDGNSSLLPKAFQLRKPQIDEVVPGEAKLNSLVEIRGRYFNPIGTKVFIESREITIISVTNERITFKVPGDMSSGLKKVKVQTGEGELFFISELKILGPVITQVVPSTAFLNDTISIVGNYFGTDPSSIIVRLNNEQVQIVSVSETEVKVIVPPYIDSSKPTIRIEVGGSVIESANLFMLKQAEIASVTPHRISSSTEILVKGKNFNPYQVNKVYLNDQQLVVVSVDYNEMVVYAQYNISANELTLKITWFDQETIYPIKLKSPWRVMPNLAPTTFGLAEVFTYDNKIFAGLDFYAPDPSVVWTYNPITDDWAEFSRFPESVAVDPFIFVIGSNAFVGSANDMSASVPYGLWSVNLNSGTWHRLNDTPFSSEVTPIGFSVDNTGYVLVETSPGESALWKYSVTSDQWTFISTVPFSANQSIQHFVLSGEFYLFDGGYLRKYNPNSNQWTDLGDAPVQPYFVAPINGKIYLGSNDRLFGEYDPSTNGWEEDLNHMGEARGSGYFISINGKGYLFGGWNANGAQTQTVFEFNPAY